jgi:acyl-CoA oxidase
MNGVDNGFIIFNNFRIPKANLLNRFSNVTEEGKFESKVESNDQRFAMQLGALSTGRILTATGTLASLSNACKIALRYAVLRTQFSKPGSDMETRLIEYPLHQYRLFPLVANYFTLI